MQRKTNTHMHMRMAGTVVKQEDWLKGRQGARGKEVRLDYCILTADCNVAKSKIPNAYDRQP